MLVWPQNFAEKTLTDGPDTVKNAKVFLPRKSSAIRYFVFINLYIANPSVARQLCASEYIRSTAWSYNFSILRIIINERETEEGRDVWR